MPKNGTSTRAALKNALSIGLMGFFLAVVFSGPVGNILQDVGPVTAGLIVIGTIAVAIVADIVAIATTVGDDAPLNAMASDRVPGAKEALVLVRNASRVNSIFSDVVGDVAGTMTGVLATPIIYGIREAYPTVPSSVASMLVIGIITFLTIGGKAAEKAFAVKTSTRIILAIGKGLHYAKRLFGWTGALRKGRRRSLRQGSNGNPDGSGGPDPGSKPGRRGRSRKGDDAHVKAGSGERTESNGKARAQAKDGPEAKSRKPRAGKKPKPGKRPKPGRAKEAPARRKSA